VFCFSNVVAEQITEQNCVHLFVSSVVTAKITGWNCACFFSSVVAEKITE